MIDSAKKLIKSSQSTWKKSLTRTYILLDLLHSLYEYWLGPFGRRSSPSRRLKPIGQEDTSGTTPNRIAVFVAYSRRLTLSNKAYLEALKKAGFAVFYINNEVTEANAIPAISALTWRAFDRQNIGRDIGAFKDGVMHLLEEGHLQRCQVLCIANDSMQFIPGKNSDSFSEALVDFARSNKIALFSHISHEILTHYQSYFQCLKSEVFLSKSFIQFWTRYMPLSHRKHCIYNGEIELSRQVYQRLRDVEILYTSDKLVEALEKSMSSDITTAKIFRLMPSPARTSQLNLIGYSLDQLMAKREKNEALSRLDMFSISDLLESGNPSHIAAFLYPYFLQCPFVKHDLATAGSFTMAQAITLFKEALIKSMGQDQMDDVNRLTNEFRDLVYSRGIPLSYSNLRREAALKGITGGFVYPSTYQ
jgi:hypothetical protein